MPLIDSSFRPAPGLSNGHLQTVGAVLLRNAAMATHQGERLELADGDFLDLAWARQKTPNKLVILTHGLEGSAADPMIQGMAAAFFRNGWSVLAWNMRGCSREPNRLLRFYHSGATEDLQAVLDHVFAGGKFAKVALAGFSLGGNLLLKYLGDQGRQVDPRIFGAVAFSVPCDLRSSVDELDKPANRLYMRRFLKSLRRKILEKKKRFPEAIDVSSLAAMKNFHEFDNTYTAPLHGFASADDYWTKSSCRHVLDRIAVPTLLVNARNDPFLGPECYPTEIAAQNPNLFLETPESGGHCGFLASKLTFWAETRALEFLETLN